MKKRFASAPVKVGRGYTVEFTFTPQGMICEWSPDVPNAADVVATFDAYRRARNAFVAARMARRLGKVGPVTTVLRDALGGAA